MITRRQALIGALSFPLPETAAAHLLLLRSTADRLVALVEAIDKEDALLDAGYLLRLQELAREVYTSAQVPD